MVPARPPRQARQRVARLLRLERHHRSVPRRADHLQGLRGFELDLGPGRRRVLLAPLLLAPAGPQLRQPEGPRGDLPDDGLLARDGRRRPAPRRDPVPVRARGHELREPARDARIPARPAPPHRWPLRGPHAAGRGQPVAGGLGRLFRRRRRVPDGVPLPGHAAHVHGHPDGGSLPDHRHPRADAADPRDRPVGRVPAQPRRADARDGDRRGARLHVPGLCQRRAGSDQPRHPAPARAAAGQRSAPDRAPERAAVLTAGHAGHLLRRRDRDGRQRLPGRSERRPDADAVERRSERGLQRGQSPTAVPARDRRSRVPLRGDQRRCPAGQPALAAVVDEAAHRAAQAPPRVRARHDRVHPAREPPHPRLRPALRRRDDPRDRQSLALRPVCGAGPVGVRGPGAGGAVRPGRVPDHRPLALLPQPGPARVHLVQPPVADGTRARNAGGAGGPAWAVVRGRHRRPRIGPPWRAPGRAAGRLAARSALVPGQGSPDPIGRAG